MAYSTAAEVKDKDISRKVAQAGWVDADIDSRIAEGDAVIDGCLAALGYALPFAATPPLVKQLSILYGRYAVLRDIHHNFAPSQAGGAGFEGFKKQFDDIIARLKNGDTVLIDSSGVVIESEDSDKHRVLISTDGVQRALTMADPTGASIDEADYADPDRLGEDL